MRVMNDGTFLPESKKELDCAAYADRGLKCMALSSILRSLYRHGELPTCHVVHENFWTCMKLKRMTDSEARARLAELNAPVKEAHQQRRDTHIWEFHSTPNAAFAKWAPPQ
jgi:hypothetical protein